MAQQTAIIWYINEMNKELRESGINLQLPKEGKIIEQAKEMEKEQIMKAYISSEYDEKQSQLYLDFLIDVAEQYYNETYKTQSHDNS